ncbi:MAG TPA: NAD-dependent epimerase/dehydratase family protein [Planctomycetaceae bacterium]|nr:NAD-dependent epimerase/dehydratase family protein [Planctomycetaceae bacterium]
MRGQRILITGVSGFTGRHLADRLRTQADATLIGLDIKPAPPGLVDLHFQCDVADAASVDPAVAEADPDVVFHLAGLFRAESDRELTRVNIGGLTRLATALRQHRTGRPVRMVIVGSAAEISATRIGRLPVDELVECHPDTAYGRTKWMATQLARNEPSESPLEIVVARAFNLVGPGLSAQLDLGDFADQVAAVVRGEAKAVQCGTLEARRDFLDVRDAVEAYILLAEQGRPREVYNVCQGQSYRMGELLDMLIELSGADVPVLSDPASPPPAVPDLYGDAKKIQLETGWAPTIPIRQSLADMLGPLINR